MTPIPVMVRMRLLAIGGLLGPALIAYGFAVGEGTAAGARTLTTPVAASTEPTASAADADLRKLIAKYAESVDKADITIASQIWLDSPDVSFIHPLGHEHGFEQIKQNVYTKLMGETFSERKLSIRDISIHVYGNSAWAEFYWDFAAKFRKDGAPLASAGRETQVYWKEPDGWRLVHVHYSGMPVTQVRQGF
jgi:ketosteroid isomerase-like protein